MVLNGPHPLYKSFQQKAVFSGSTSGDIRRRQYIRIGPSQVLPDSVEWANRQPQIGSPFVLNNSQQHVVCPLFFPLFSSHLVAHLTVRHPVYLRRGLASNYITTKALPVLLYHPTLTLADCSRIPRLNMQYESKH